MNKKQYLDIVKREIKFFYDRSSIELELSQHIDDSIVDLIDEGYSEEDAEIRAINQLGDPVEVGQLLNKEHHPVLGYLWYISKFIMIGLLILSIIPIFLMGYSAFVLTTRASIDNSIVDYPIDIEIDLPTHYVTIDNIGIDDKNNYYFTYRSWTKYWYSRAGWSCECFYITNYDGSPIDGGAFSDGLFFGRQGYKYIENPSSNIVYLVTVEGDKIEINLKEYFDETNP